MEKCPKCGEEATRVEREVVIVVVERARRATYPEDGARTFHHEDGSRCYLPGHFFSNSNGEEDDTVDLEPVDIGNPEPVDDSEGDENE